MRQMVAIHRFRVAVGVCALIFTTALFTSITATQRVAPPGDPLPGLTVAEFEAFRLGLDDFLEVESAEEGLGPAFNGPSCAACHNVPAIGGMSPIAEVRAAKRGPAGEFVALDSSGETLFHLFSIPNHGCQPVIPDDATVIARRIPIPLFGAGLVEAIPDETILALEDPFDRNRDGVSGRAAIVRDLGTGATRVGRFGWKAQHATLLTFGADAYRNEMGITNEIFPLELAIGISSAQMRRCDPIPDPEDRRDPRTRLRGIDNFESFMRLLAPVAKLAGSTNIADVAAGEVAFHAAGCAVCHVPVLMTGPSVNPLFDRKLVPLFSDLLLHDVGTGDGIVQASAQAGEIRTPALWGLRLRRPFLHDGSAATIDEAVRRHAGEALLARRGVERMTPQAYRQLLAFLKSL
ncbi:MAG: hypothetical protein HQ485_08240 [Acidobacteria bacterium]|nr:hypothetical protein [Acidobacteriota bacterium]